jgi:hypothetical protein
MEKPHVNNIRVVLVTTDNCDHQIWMTATSREKAAVDRILDAIPEGWTASLLDIKLSPVYTENPKSDDSGDEVRPGWRLN